MKKLIFILSLGFASFSLLGQPNSGNPDFNPTPIDGGISLLIAAGAALGGKKAYDHYKNRKEEA